MVQVKFEIDIDAGFFSDITLVLKRQGDYFADGDKNRPGSEDYVTMRLHRLILSSLVPYFASYFSFQKKSGGEIPDRLEIEVPDVLVSSKFLRSLYGEEISWTEEEILKLFLCRSFFGFEISEREVLKLNVQPKNFDSLLSVVSLPEVEWSEAVEMLIRRNLPENYQWPDGCEEIKSRIETQIYLFFSLGSGEESCVQMVNAVSGETIWTLPPDIRQVFSLPDGKRVVTVSDRISLWDVERRQVIRNYARSDDSILRSGLTQGRSCFSRAEVTPDGRTLIAVDCDGFLTAWELEAGDLIFSQLLLEQNCVSCPQISIAKVSARGDQVFVALRCPNLVFFLFNLKTQNYSHWDLSSSSFGDSAWISDKKIIFTSDTELKTIDVETGEIKKVFQKYKYIHSCDCEDPRMCYCTRLDSKYKYVSHTCLLLRPDGKRLYAGNSHGTILRVNCKNRVLEKEFRSDDCYIENGFLEYEFRADDQVDDCSIENGYSKITSLFLSKGGRFLFSSVGSKGNIFCFDTKFGTRGTNIARLGEYKILALLETPEVFSTVQPKDFSFQSSNFWEEKTGFFTFQR